MLVLALDTTTRGGSMALVGDGRTLEVASGDPSRTHATRLPGEILDCLARHGARLSDIDLYGVAIGPGSFTGLRIGIATVQGLAFAHGRPVVGVSALDALAEAGGQRGPAGAGAFRAAWIDAQRGEVYARLYRFDGEHWQPAGEPVVERPDRVLADWAGAFGGAPVEFVGDGAVVHAAEIDRVLASRSRVAAPVPPIAGAVAWLAVRGLAEGRAAPPHAVRPLYVRRPDAELARDRRRTGAD